MYSATEQVIKMLLLRVISALAGVPLLIAIVMLGGWFLFVAVVMLAVLAQRELYAILSYRGFTGPRSIGYLGTLFVLWYVYSGQSWVLPHFFTGLVIVLFTSQILQKETGNIINNIAMTLLGVFYPGLLFSYLFLLRAKGVLPLLLIFVITWAYDSSAYFVGTAWGKHRLLPAISPNKTVEGTLGGLAASTLVAPLFAASLGVSPWHLAALGFFLGCIAQVGDLVESMVKRYAGVKDSGKLIPGHGGILDRFDGILLTVPLGHFIFRLVGLI